MNCTRVTNKWKVTKIIHKAKHCMNNLDHPFYNHGARSVCGHFLARNRVALELKITLDDKMVTCKKCLIKMGTNDE